ncbi:hypothetical protein [Melittangium boletus]|uniref:hypothetical protein n=1 Tax=Melittangium boletus TaxID=83453 RepID=UPI001C54E34D|nr:hypothetical protein [Melittangium boletus]
MKKAAHPVDVSLNASDSLAYLGYPTLRQVDFFLDLSGLEKWRTRHLLSFPSVCCVCSVPATRFLSSRGDIGLFGFFRKDTSVERIPHCDEHGSGTEARLLVLSKSWSEFVLHVSLIGLNEVFLAETKRLNQIGEVPPPWRAFPGYSPVTSGWRQGNGEYWMRHAWDPFWQRLSAEDRADYLQRWDVPLEWKSLLF